ncbi:MAG: hypothetical protein WC710_15205 [Gallionella sp.]|jgi:hypothetical protein
MLDTEQNENEAACGRSDSTAVLCLDAETVQCYLYALLAEAKRRGGMFPQTSDEQDADSAAVRRVCGLVEHYAGRGYPRSDEIAKLHAIRALNMGHNA